MPKITYATRIHVMTVRLIDGKPKDSNVGFHFVSSMETIVTTGLKNTNSKRDADKYHEELSDALLL